MGIAAAPVSTFACYLAVTSMNLYFLVRFTGISAGLRAIWLKPLAASMISAGTAKSVYFTCNLFLQEKLAVMPAISAAVFVYLVLVRKLKILHRDDLILLPGRQKLIKWFGISEYGN